MARILNDTLDTPNLILISFRCKVHGEIPSKESDKEKRVISFARRHKDDPMREKNDDNDSLRDFFRRRVHLKRDREMSVSLNVCQTLLWWWSKTSLINNGTPGVSTLLNIFFPFISRIRKCLLSSAFWRWFKLSCRDRRQLQLQLAGPEYKIRTWSEFQRQKAQSWKALLLQATELSTLWTYSANMHQRIKLWRKLKRRNRRKTPKSPRHP